ncbi:hypothetical protein J2Y68_001042 [Paenarthrobacter nitroguajacolicus]|nr:hypothetical protein [Paenarthrobacter nitroguajacolicus]
MPRGSSSQRLSLEVRWKLAQLDSKLEGFLELRVGAQSPSETGSRRNEHHIPALRLEEIVLRKVSEEAGAGCHLSARLVGADDEYGAIGE